MATRGVVWESVWHNRTRFEKKAAWLEETPEDIELDRCVGMTKVKKGAQRRWGPRRVD